jgi:hypothetical protein
MDELNELLVVEIRAHYRDQVLRWAAAAAEPQLANRLFDVNRAYFHDVRDVAEGRAAITELLTDDDENVRLKAATHSLLWNSQQAIGVLDLISRASTTLNAVTAKYTLKAYDEGKLNLD